MADTIVKIIIDADNRTGDEFKEVEASGKKAGAGFDALAKGAVIAAAGIAVLKQGLAVTVDMIKLGNEIERTESALVAYAGSAETAAASIVAIQHASQGGLDKLSAMQNASRLFAMGLVNTATEAGELTDVIINLGASMGQDARTSFEDFSLMLANTSIPRLDFFGISAGAVRSRMLELAATMPELDRQTRFAMATIEIGTDKVKDLKDEGFEAVSSVDKLTASLTDMKNAGAVAISEALNPMIDEIVAMREETEENMLAVVANTDSLAEYNKLAIQSQFVFGGAAEAFHTVTQAQFDKAQATNEATAAWEAETKAVEAAKDIAEEPVEIGMVFDDVGSFAGVESAILGMFQDVEFLMNDEIQRIQADTNFLQEVLGTPGLSDEQIALAQAGLVELATEAKLLIGDESDYTIAINLRDDFGLEYAEARDLITQLKEEDMAGINRFDFSPVANEIQESLFDQFFNVQNIIDGEENSLTGNMANLNKIRFPDMPAAINTGITSPLSGANSQLSTLQSGLEGLPTEISIHVVFDVDEFPVIDPP